MKNITPSKLNNPQKTKINTYVNIKIRLEELPNLKDSGISVEI